jgi:hypothetical protein
VARGTNTTSQADRVAMATFIVVNWYHKCDYHSSIRSRRSKPSGEPFPPGNMARPGKILSFVLGTFSFFVFFMFISVFVLFYPLFFILYL